MDTVKASGHHINIINNNIINRPLYNLFKASLP